MMIDDDDVALGGATAHLGNEAAIIFFAFLAETGIGARIEFVPKGARLGQFGEFGAVPGLRCFLPGGDGAIVFDLFESAEHGLIGEIDELFAAKIIVASFHVADAELAISVGKKRLLERGN